MKLPKDTSPMIWGAVVGGILCAVLGFTWGGWVTGRTAREEAGVAAHDAAVAVLAPLCAERFRAQDGATAKMAELADAKDWQRSGLIEKSGFAMLPSSKTSDSDVARACADILLAPTTPKT